MRYKNNTSTKELAEIICQAILEEPHFTKDVLIPKISILITEFRLRLSSMNYEKSYNEKDTARLVRANEIQHLEINFWKHQLKEKIGAENIKPYYDALDIERAKWGKK